MKARVLSRAERLARERQEATITAVAERLREIIADASIEIEGSRIVVSGRQLTKRWLSNPDLRFLPRGPR